MRKYRKTTFVIITILFIWVILAVIPSFKSIENNNPFVIKKDNRAIMIAHGGGNLEFPDNTLEAFYNAYSIDQNFMMETDVSITKDNVIILSHDITLDRKTELVNTYISDVNYSDLVNNEVDFGYENKVENKINTSGQFIKYKNYLNEEVTPLDVDYPEGILPRHNHKFLVTSLEDLIIAFPNNYINVEIKQSDEIGIKALMSVVELMSDLDEEYNTFERIVLASFHDEIYSQFKKIQKEYPDFKYSPATKSVATFYILQFLKLDIFFQDKVSVLQIPQKQSVINLATKRLVKNAHRHNIAVHYWTIDDEDDMIKLLNIGADGIMTNKPTLLKTVFDNYYSD